MSKRSQGSSNDAENRVEEQSKPRNTKQNVVEVALFFGLELQALNANKPDDYRDNRECHHHAVRSVSEVNREQPKRGLLDQNEEQDQANEASYQQKQSHEETFAGSDAIHAAMSSVGQCDGASWQHGFQTSLQVRFCLVGPARVPSNVLPHDVNHRSAYQAVLDDKRVQVGRCIIDDRSHYVDASASVLVQWSALVECVRRGPDAGSVGLINDI